MNRIVSVFLVCLVAAVSELSAQLPPAVTPGFKAESAYQFGNLDQVALMNGQLSVNLPIAGPYAVNGGLSWGLSLSYSNSAWEAYPQFESGEITDGVVYPKPDRKAGLGWRVSLGELRVPPASGGSYVPRWIYSDPSGGEHVLYQTLHLGESQDPGDPPIGTPGLEGFNYTRDNTFLRVACTFAGQDRCVVEHPNGDQHVFLDFASSGPQEFRLTEIVDQFNNKVMVGYDGSNTQWTITQTGSSRSVIVHFFDPGGSYPNQRRLIDYIDVPCFQNACDGGAQTHARWNFVYSDQQVWRPATFNASYTTPLLTKVLSTVTLPDASYFEMTSNRAGAGNAHGELDSLRLPTAGRIEWDWGSFEFPGIHTTGPCPQQIPPDINFWTSVISVAVRREYDRTGQLFGTWTYDRLVTPSKPATAQKMMVTVNTPLKDKSEHFFSVYPAENGAVCEPTQVDPPLWGNSISQFGMPFTRETALADPMTAPVQRFLSSLTYDCDVNGSNCVIARTIYQAWEIDQGGSSWNNGALTDRNRRLLSERIVYNDDDPGTGPNWKRRTWSDNDGVGHFRTETADGSFPANRVRTTITSFNPLRGTYPATYVPFPSSQEWLLELFTTRSTSETNTDACDETPITQYAWEQFCFDTASGFLNRHRILKNEGSAMAPHGSDVLRVFEQFGASEGNVEFEGWYGGDDGTQLWTGADACSPSLAGIPPDFRMFHVYQYGLRAKSRFTDDDYDTSALDEPDEVEHWLQNLTIDDKSGLVASSSDSSDLVTTYKFDLLGRLTQAVPDSTNGAAHECYQYFKETGPTGMGARVVHSSRATSPTGCAGTLMAQDEVRYDGLGRVRRSRRLRDDGQFDDRFTFFNGNGGKSFVSEWGRHTSSDNAANYGTEFGNQDPFGRARTILRYIDNVPSTEATFEFKGVREVKKTQNVGTIFSAGQILEEPVETYERYDPQGRLVEVQEPSQGAMPGVKTYYSYDVGGRLKRSETDPSGTTSDQVRCWNYDQRGFLQAENHPELTVPAGGDDVTFSNYDAMGHARRRVQGYNPGGTPVGDPEKASMQYDFDLAARLVRVWDLRDEPGSADDRRMKEWTYATANSGANKQKAKVSLAKGYNYPVLGGSTVEARFDEDFIYDQPGGQLGSRTVNFLANGGQQDRFFHSEAFDALGQRTSITMPVCIAVVAGYCVTPQPAMTVSNVYSFGHLTGVTGWASPITYHANGLWSQVTHANGTVDSQSLAADRRPRPALLRTTKDANTLWSSGTFAYDAAGNIKQLGAAPPGVFNTSGQVDQFQYDRVQRLTHAWIRIPALQEQVYSFDLHGNINSIQSIINGSSSTRPTDTNPATNRLTAGAAAYDSRGNLKSYSLTTHEWDRLNRQVKRQVGGEPAYRFFYTADDERILTMVDYADTTPDEFRWILRDFGGKPLRDFRSSPWGQMVRRSFIYRSGQLLGAYTDSDTQTAHEVEGNTLVPMAPTPQGFHYHLDHLGSSRVETNSGGIVTQSWTLFPFGEEVVAAPQSGILLRFAGHERDLYNTGGPADDEDYMHARFNSPVTGRLLSVDPSTGSPRTPQSWNRYAYVRGNPLKFVDPNGMKEVEAWRVVWSRLKHIIDKHIRKVDTPGTKFIANNPREVQKDVLKTINSPDRVDLQKSSGNLVFQKAFNADKGPDGERVVRVYAKQLSENTLRVETAHPAFDFKDILGLLPGAVGTWLGVRDATEAGARVAGDAIEQAAMESGANQHQTEQEELIQQIDD